MTDTTSAQPTEKNLDRRVILKGAAWSVPVIAAATAAPFASASDPVCTPVNASLRTTFSNVTVAPGGTPFQYVPTTPVASYNSRSHHWNQTSNINTTASLRNQGPDTIPASTITWYVSFSSVPGRLGGSSPYQALGLPSPLPTGWTLVASEETQSLSPEGIYVRSYDHMLAYSLPLAPGQSAPSLTLTAVRSNPRPTPASYGTNLRPNPAGTLYGHHFIGFAQFRNCETYQNEADLRSSNYWGVFIPRPGSSKSVKTLSETGTASETDAADTYVIDPATLPRFGA